MKAKPIKAETFSESVYFFLFRISAFAGIAILLLILFLLWMRGYEVISWRFLTYPWQHQDITRGGIWYAIVGSFYLGIGVMLISFPLGIGTAIYLTEYAKNALVKRVIRLTIRNLAGVPSVIYGLFGLAVFVNFLSFGTSLLSAALTLSIMTLPWVVTAATEALESVPKKFREASLALGASQWQTISKVTFPAAFAGSITGAILGMARALGETAPIIIVGATFYLSTLPSSPLDKFMALPYHAFILATQHSSPHALSYAAGTTLVLVMIIFLLSIGAICIRYSYRKKKAW